MNVEAYESRPVAVTALQYLGPTVPGHDVAAVEEFTGFKATQLGVPADDPGAGLVELSLARGATQLHLKPGWWAINWPDNGISYCCDKDFEGTFRPQEMS